MDKIKAQSGSAANIYETLEIDQDTIRLAQELVAEMRVLKVDREIMEALGEFYPKSARIVELQPVDIRVKMEDGNTVDPLTFRGYTAMDKGTRGYQADLDEDDELALDVDEFESEVAALTEPMTVKGFLASLEEFLDHLPDAKRGSVFLSQAGDGVCVNILIGMAFAGTDATIRQVNVIVAPTDRELLNSQGTTINDLRTALLDGDVAVPPASFDEMGKEELRQACRERGVPYGKLNNDGMRTALKAHEAFDEAREFLDGSRF